MSRRQKKFRKVSSLSTRKWASPSGPTEKESIEDFLKHHMDFTGHPLVVNKELARRLRAMGIMKNYTINQPLPAK